MAIKIHIEADSVADLRKALQEMCGSVYQQTSSPQDAQGKPDICVADMTNAAAAAAVAEAKAKATAIAATAAEAKAKADAEAAAKAKAAKIKAAKDAAAKAAADIAALEAGTETGSVTEESLKETVDETKKVVTVADVKARLAELKSSTRPNVIDEVSEWKVKHKAPSLSEMDATTLANLMAFLA